MFRNLFGTAVATRHSDSELATECKQTLRDAHKASEDEAARLVEGLTDTDLQILLYLMSTGNSPSEARKRIDAKDDLDVMEMRIIESPSQRMRK